MRNIISVDVEDYFHPSEVQKSVPLSDWESLPSRVESSTRGVLDFFAKYEVKGTFFILGWVANRFPALVRDIASAGHEVACHSYNHQLIYTLTPQQFREDTLRAVKTIEDACGITPRSYRAPSYSITHDSMWALDILSSLGFTHDSSIYPIAHDRYGIQGFARHAQMMATPSGAIIEVPVASVRLSARLVAPIGGGAYLRLLPYRYTAAGIRRLNREGHPACLYLHPWEIDARQPRIASGLISRLRTYTGLSTMPRKLDRLLKDFAFMPLTEAFPAATVGYLPENRTAMTSAF